MPTNLYKERRDIEREYVCNKKIRGLKEINGQCFKFLVLLMILPSPTYSSRLRNDLPTYFSEYLLGLSLDPQPVFYDSYNTEDTETNITTPTPQILQSTMDPPVLTILEPKQSDYLPDNVRPLHYTLAVRPNIHTDYKMKGTVEMILEVMRPTPNITFHSAKMFIRTKGIKLEPNDDGGALPNITHYTNNPKIQLFTVHLTKEIEAGRHVRLYIPYVASLSSWGEGFFAVTFDDDDGVEKKFVATMHQPTSARIGFPCFDEPHLKATFTLHVVRETNMTALSNMPLNHTTKMKGEPGWVIDSFEKTPLMSTYNLMMIVCPFGYIDVNTKPGLPIRVWGRGSILGETSFLQEAVVGILNNMEEYTGIPFSLPKLDLAFVPADTYAAFEGWGLIIYFLDDEHGAYNPEKDPNHKRNKMALLNAHELAHQWFGNLVTPRRWTNIWLSEGLATYFQYTAALHILPDEDFIKYGPVRMQQMMLDVDSRPYMHPLLLSGHQNTIQHLMFDSIEYHKGGILVRMMNYFLTPQTLRKGLRSFLNTHQYDSATQDDLWLHLTQAAHSDGTLDPSLNMTTIMNTWTTKAGYPIVKVVRSPSGSSATVYQERFIVDLKNDTHDRHEYKWWVPLTYTDQTAPDFTDTRIKAWMWDTETQTTVRPLPPKDQWVIFNVQSGGFYRVNYDDQNWRLLIKQLLTDHTVIHVINRAQLIDDSLELAMTGELDYKLTLDLVSYLVNEKDPLPWKAYMKNAERIQDHLSNSPSFGSLKKYTLSLAAPVFFRLELTNIAKKFQVEHSELVNVACNAGHPDCVYLAISLYSQWMSNQGNITDIPLELREMVLCTAIAHGGEDEWDFAWRRYSTTNNMQYKQQLLNSLACRKQNYQHELNGTAEFRDDILEINTAQDYGTPVDQQALDQHAWDSITSHWHITLGDDKIGMEKLILVAAHSFSTPHDIQELVKFIDEIRDDPIAVRALKTTLRRAALNKEWREKYGSSVSDWLRNKGFHEQANVIA